LLKGEREYEVKRLIDCRLKGEARPDYILSPSTGKLRPSPPPSNTHILPEGSIRARKPSCKSSSFFINKYWSKSVAASTIVPKMQFYHSDLPPEPQFYQEVMKLSALHKQGFIAAMPCEISDVKRKGAYRMISWKYYNAQYNKVLPPLSVFKYKFDSEEYLVRYKAQICVCGDLQTSAKDTYAATLAVQVFRAITAVNGL
jgi:hypothetical protein